MTMNAWQHGENPASKSQAWHACLFYSIFLPPTNLECGSACCWSLDSQRVQPSWAVRELGVVPAATSPGRCRSSEQGACQSNGRCADFKAIQDCFHPSTAVSVWLVLPAMLRKASRQDPLVQPEQASSRRRRRPCIWTSRPFHPVARCNCTCTLPLCSLAR